MEINTDYLEKLGERKKEKVAPTYKHDIVFEICDYLYGSRDSDCVRMWLGIAGRLGEGILKDKFEQMKGRGINSARYLMACTRKK